MKFIDLSVQQKRIRDKIENNILMVLDHGQYIMGPEVRRIEEKLGEFVGAKHAVSCASGTDALLMALMAYNIGPGDAVFTTPFTFIATAEVISLLGATPVFVDIDPNTFNIDPEKLEQAIRAVKNGSTDFPLPKPATALPLSPKGVIAVDLFGLPADYDKINTIADQHGLFVIEDAAQSFGAEYNGRKTCNLADIACTSFFPAKPFGCYGDGGMCFTNDDELSEIMESLRVHGKGSYKYDNVRIGINGRLDTIQAAILLAKFDIFPEEIRLRQIVADRYAGYLSDLSFPVTPNIPLGMTSAWAQYSVLARRMKESQPQYIILLPFTYKRRLNL
jgi:dTDP-4-amino-4,6-dideoxygalactose transaminase